MNRSIKRKELQCHFLTCKLKRVMACTKHLAALASSKSFENPISCHWRSLSNIRSSEVYSTSGQIMTIMMDPSVLCSRRTNLISRQTQWPAKVHQGLRYGRPEGKKLLRGTNTSHLTNRKIILLMGYDMIWWYVSSQKNTRIFIMSMAIFHTNVVYFMAHLNTWPPKCSLIQAKHSERAAFETAKAVGRDRNFMAKSSAFGVSENSGFSPQIIH